MSPTDMSEYPVLDRLCRMIAGGLPPVVACGVLGLNYRGFRVSLARARAERRSGRRGELEFVFRAIDRALAKASRARRKRIEALLATAARSTALRRSRKEPEKN